MKHSFAELYWTNRKEYYRLWAVAKQERTFNVSYPTFWLCEICDKPITLSKGEVYLDHDHITGLFRGWLCNLCNTNLDWAAKFELRWKKYLG